MRSGNLRPLSDASLETLRGVAAREGLEVICVPLGPDDLWFGRPYVAPEPEPTAPAHAIDFAKQLIGFARSLSDVEIAKAARLPVETVAQLRGGSHGEA